jgi:beta-N-acetylhexosaminidase
MMTVLGIAISLLLLTPQQKAEMLVVTTVRPGIFSGAAQITFADQEGGLVHAVPGAPAASASSYRTVSAAFAGGRATARALRRADVDVDFAPVFDTADGPLGSRQFVRPELAVAFARGLGSRACAKHFPGLGSAAISTDERPHVDARVRPRDLAPYRAAIRAGLECVMVSNAFYGGAPYRATIEPATYRLLRGLGFNGIAVTDSLSIVRSAPVERWAPQAIRAGADIVLFTSPAQARRAVRALIPLARRGELDEHVRRLLRYRAALG